MNPRPLVDTHAHLDDDQFSGDLTDVLDRAAAAGVARVLAVGVSAESSRATVGLANRYAELRAAVGVHPNHAAAAAPGDWDEVLRLTSDSAVVAVGETGLDRHWEDTPFPLQEEYFTRHLELGRQRGLPVVVHCRDAAADVVRMLGADYERRGAIAGVMHSFAADWGTASACLDMGLYISFAGMLTYKNAGALRDLAAQVPRDRVLIETDSPYLAPAPVRGRRNEPANVIHTLGCLAACQGLDVEEMARAVCENAARLFGPTFGVQV